jgi:uncharacterized protein
VTRAVILLWLLPATLVALADIPQSSSTFLYDWVGTNQSGKEVLGDARGTNINVRAFIHNCDSPQNEEIRGPKDFLAIFSLKEIKFHRMQGKDCAFCSVRPTNIVCWRCRSLATDSWKGKAPPKTTRKLCVGSGRAAEHRLSDAQANLAYCHQFGFGVATNHDEALKWYRRAAEQTNSFAMMQLGVMSIQGHGVPLDIEDAKRWWLSAADAGNARAMSHLGDLARKGLFGTNSQAEAFAWYKKSAALRDRFGCWSLAVAYDHGQGTPKDSIQFVFWATKAAQQGVGAAQFYLGEAYRIGKGVSQDKGLALSWWRSAATNNYAPAFYNLALEALADKNLVESSRYMFQAATYGHREAQVYHALACFGGDVIPQNKEEGKRWLLRSADEAWPKAEYFVAIRYLAGADDFPVDIGEGNKWLLRAAQHHNMEAQRMLVIRLVTGQGCPPNPVEGAQWFRTAAEHGDAAAQNDLGYTLEVGPTGKADLVEVCMWYLLSRNQGQSKAEINLQRVRAKLSDEQFAEAQRRAREFRPKPAPELKPLKEEEESAIIPSN